MWFIISSLSAGFRNKCSLHGMGRGSWASALRWPLEDRHWEERAFGEVMAALEFSEKKLEEAWEETAQAALLRSLQALPFPSGIASRGGSGWALPEMPFSRFSPCHPARPFQGCLIPFPPTRSDLDPHLRAMMHPALAHPVPQGGDQHPCAPTGD